MLFQDFQQEQLFQKSKSYFKNLMNYSLTTCFSFLKTWDSLSSEFAGEAVHFPSLYRLLQNRILHDPEFQFYLLYVNNLLKYEKGRKEMGLTNSVIFKILFIMLKKEEMRFEEKSIFKGNNPSKVSLKRVKTETPSFSIPPVNTLKSSNTVDFKVPVNNPIILQNQNHYLSNNVYPNPYIHHHQPSNHSSNLMHHDKNYLQGNSGNYMPHQNYHVKNIGPMPSHQQHIQPPLNHSSHLQPNLMYPMQRPIMNQTFPNSSQIHKVYPNYQNIQKNFPKNSNYSNMYQSGYIPKKPVRKPMYQPQKKVKPSPITPIPKKKLSPVPKKEKKTSSLSDDSISISSSSISLSPSSKEESRRKSKSCFNYKESLGDISQRNLRTRDIENTQGTNTGTIRREGIGILLYHLHHHRYRHHFVIRVKIVQKVSQMPRV
jgi:hypothetical protein